MSKNENPENNKPNNKKPENIKNDQQRISQVNQADNRLKLGERPEFYLIYILFYFVPWFFKAPSIMDVIGVVISLALFLPIYLHGFKERGIHGLPNAIAVAIIGLVISSLHGAHGVFYVYAMVMAGFVRPERVAWMAIASFMAIFTLFTWAFQQSWWDLVFPGCIGLIQAVSCISMARKIEEEDELERERHLERYLAADTERERIAQDLHDLLGQTLTLVSVKSELAVKLFEDNSEQAKQEIIDIQSITKVALKDVREAVSGIHRTTVVDELKRARQILATAEIELSVEGAIPKFNQQVNQVLGLTIREATTNIVRHAKADKATIRFEGMNEEFLLSIQDNGMGCENLEKDLGGLQGLQNRVAKLGGQTKVDCFDGVSLSIRVPNWSL